MSHPADHSRSLHQAFTAARKRAGTRPFLAESAVCGGRVWSFEEAGREVDDLIQIYARQGWGHGHRVALAVGNHPRHFFHFLALNHLGASIVPLNPDHRGGEIRHAMSLSGAQLVVATEPRRAELYAALQEDGPLAHMAVLDAKPIGAAAACRTLRRGRTVRGPLAARGGCALYLRHFWATQRLRAHQ